MRATQKRQEGGTAWLGEGLALLSGTLESRACDPKLC